MNTFVIFRCVQLECVRNIINVFTNIMNAFIMNMLITLQTHVYNIMNAFGNIMNAFITFGTHWKLFECVHNHVINVENVFIMF